MTTQPTRRFRHRLASGVLFLTLLSAPFFTGCDTVDPGLDASPTAELSAVASTQDDARLGRFDVEEKPNAGEGDNEGIREPVDAIEFNAERVLMGEEGREAIVSGSAEEAVSLGSVLQVFGKGYQFYGEVEAVLSSSSTSNLTGEFEGTVRVNIVDF